MSKYSRTGLVCLTIGLLILMALDVYIFINRRKGFNTELTDYKSLYYPRRTAVIFEFDVEERKQLAVKISGMEAGGWEIITDGSQGSFWNGHYPQIELSAGTHTYRLIPGRAGQYGRDTIELKINYTPREVYAASANPNTDSYHVIYSSIPVGDFKRFPLDFFTGSDSDYPFEDVKNARGVIDSMGIEESNDTETRIRKLAKFLLDRLHDKNGIPSINVAEFTAWQIYQSALTGRSPIWCSGFQKIYVFFANLAGIPSRVLNSSGSLNGVSLSGHAFAESYIKEKNRWAYIDLSSSKLFVKNNNGDFVNTLDLFHTLLAGSTEGMTALVYQNGELAEVPYEDVADIEEYYFTREASFIFPAARQAPPRLSTRMYRYLFQPDPAYALAGSNIRLRLKEIAFWPTLAIAFLWIVHLVKFAGSKKRSNRQR